jgi:Uma2 family endonuclease
MAISYPIPVKQVEYPSSDGQPMAESDFQRKFLTYGVEALSIYFQDRPDVYVSGNLFIYYEEGDPEAVVAPDVFVVFGTEKRDRPSYLLWQEPKGPDFVLEITSRRTRSQDQGPKRGTYAFLGVREYFLYDPTGDYLTPPLQGFRLVGDNYQPMPHELRPDGTLTMHSHVLGLDLRLEHGELRLYDPTTEQKLLSHHEAEQARQAAEQAWQAAEQARQAAEELARREAVARQAAEARLAELAARLREREGPP